MIKAASFFKYQNPFYTTVAGREHLQLMVEDRPCPDPLPYDQEKIGWSDFNCQDGHIVLTMHIKNKPIDSRAVKCEVARRVKALGDRKVSKKEKLQLTDTVIQEMLPHIPFKDEFVNCYLHSGSIVIDRPMKKAEQLVTYLINHLTIQPSIVPFAENFDINIIRNIVDYELEDHTDFAPTGSFSYVDFVNDKTVTEVNDEKDGVCDWDDITIPTSNYLFKWFELKESSAGATFRLNADASLKSIKLPDQDNDEADYDAKLELRRAFILLLDDYKKLLNLLNSFRR